MKNKTLTILDSNVWIAFFDKEDSTHKKAVAIFKKLKVSELAVTEYIILEVATILKKYVGFDIANTFLFKLAQENITIIEDENLLKETVKIFANSARNNLSFVDCSLVYLSGKYKVITFDKKLANKLK